MIRTGLDLLTAEASSSELIYFNFALGAEAKVGGEQDMALQAMPKPQLETTGLAKGDIVALLMNAVVGEEAGVTLGWPEAVLELFVLLEKGHDDVLDEEKVC